MSGSMSSHVAFIFSVLILARLASAHSVQTTPRAINTQACRLGDGGYCPGPCDFQNIEGIHENSPYTRFPPPSKPAAVYSRGQRVSMTYLREIMAPEVRFSLSRLPTL